ncbi:MAG: ferritin-like domain-containing protein [Actinomycetota bacterium]|nr:ferritin-like domain-containing protein [Actinomycetota bacterium]
MGGALGAGAILGLRSRAGAQAAPSREQDGEILNALLVLERTQEGFYDQAVRRGALPDRLGTFAATVAPHEREHAALLARLLGNRAAPRPSLAFGDAVADPAAFQRLAIELEEATMAAYIGQGANLTKATIRHAARIVAVEGRHAAWIRDLAGEDPAPRAADPPREMSDVLADLRRRGIVR